MAHTLVILDMDIIATGTRPEEGRVVVSFKTDGAVRIRLPTLLSPRLSATAHSPNVGLQRPHRPRSITSPRSLLLGTYPQRPIPDVGVCIGRVSVAR